MISPRKRLTEKLLEHGREQPERKVHGSGKAFPQAHICRRGCETATPSGVEACEHQTLGHSTVLAQQLRYLIMSHMLSRARLTRGCNLKPTFRIASHRFKNKQKYSYLIGPVLWNHKCQ